MAPIITRPSKPGKKLLSVSLTMCVPSIVVIIFPSLFDSKHMRYELRKSSPNWFPASRSPRQSPVIARIIHRFS